jgi:N-acetylmuramoyl-L-alanine amidase
VLALAALVLWRVTRPAGASVDPGPGGGWPHPSAELQPPAVVFPPGFGRRRIYLDAGHGAPDNTGNLSSLCEQEQDFTLRAATELARRLERTGHFEVKLSRAAGETVEYQERVEQAAAWQAEVFVSLHSDVRGRSTDWSPEPGLTCPRTLKAPGFSVLWSDEAAGALPAERARLARAVAQRLQQAGLLPYAGADYQGQYAADDRQQGVFVDRHAPERRIFVLRAPAMPSVIIETHNAWDPREAQRWNEARTHEAFAAAVAAALVDVLQ